MFCHSIVNFFEYSAGSGGHAGGQAEYARVPFADVNLLKVSPDTNEYPDSRVLFLSDILPTAWHGNAPQACLGYANKHASCVHQED